MPPKESSQTTSYDIIETQAHNELTVGTSFVPDDEVITASQAHTEPSPYDTQSTPKLDDEENGVAEGRDGATMTQSSPSALQKRGLKRAQHSESDTDSNGELEEKPTKKKKIARDSNAELIKILQNERYDRQAYQNRAEQRNRQLVELMNSLIDVEQQRFVVKYGPLRRYSPSPEV